MTDLEGAVWQILRQTYVRLLCLPEGRNPRRLTLEEQNLLLDPHMRQLEHDHKMVMEVVQRAQTAGISHVHGLLHNREGVDNEMLDQTVEYATYDLAKRAQED